jgi:hypothetical protein
VAGIGDAFATFTGREGDTGRIGPSSRKKPSESFYNCNRSEDITRI